MPALELSFLGSANAFTPGGRYWSGFVANGRYVFEAPPTLLPHLKRLGVPLADIRAVFISHFHGDHFLGLPFLFLEHLYLTPRREDLLIVGPPGIEAKIEDLADLAFPGLSSADAGYRRVYVEAQPGGEQPLADVSFQALRMRHAGGKLECFGYKLRLGDKTVAYTGDTEMCDEIFLLAQGTDVLVMDCSYCEGEGPEHVGLADMLEVRKRVSPRTTIVLTHLDGDPDVAIEGLLVARDFATFRFP
jgi:ribonuclease BN (tRNA processing enzyme)